MLTPTRRRGVEILDLPDVDPEVVTRSLGDVARWIVQRVPEVAAAQERYDALTAERLP